MTQVETVRYASLIQARREIKELDSTVDADADARVLDALYFVSGRIDKITVRTFAPYVATRYYDAEGDHLDAATGRLLVDEPLLAVTALSVSGQGLVVGTDYVTEPRGETPITALRLLPSASVDWSSHDGDWQDSIVVTGIWGERSGYSRALVASGDTVQNVGGLSDSGVSLIVANLNGADARNRSPRFSPGQLLAVTSNGATEYLEVQAATIGTDETPTHTLTVRRGARGSTPATHANGTAIAIWTPEPDIERTAILWTAYLYKRRGDFAQVTFDGVTSTKWPADAPQEVVNILMQYEEPAAWGAV